MQNIMHNMICAQHIGNYIYIYITFENKIQVSLKVVKEA